ncbi:MAG TPA: prolyl oligopeptidase family serine peptidase [Streptosporangiaceae bacterium]|nr:prolyl oligopeptidase family serine peptidase [Streptosporangiaceae bacterium]
MTDSFPRQQARTQGFSLGVPRSFQISPDGSRVAFLRSRGGSDPVTCLWVLDVGTGSERLAADPAALPAGGGRPAGGGPAGEEPAEERARRERSREQAAGIVAFATDDALTMAVFAVAGRVYLAGLRAVPGQQGTPSDAAAPMSVRAVPAATPVLDPRPDPAGRMVAYVHAGALRITDLATGHHRQLIGPDGTPGLSYGLAEFIAAEEMERQRGYWWAPDGSALLVARVDTSGVNRWHIADPAHPGRPGTEIAYPAAGTPNAEVSLLQVGLDGSVYPVAWDQAAFPYLVTVNWDDGLPLIVVQSRDQRRMQLLSADPARGAVAVLREDTDDRWLDIVPGVPARTGDGRIVWTADADGAKRLLVATPEEFAEGSPEPVTPAGLQVRQVLAADGGTVLFSASGEEPSEIGLWAYGPDGLTRLAAGAGDGGVTGGTRAGGTTLVSHRSLRQDGVTVRVVRDGQPGTAVTSLAEHPDLPVPQPGIFAAGPRGIRTAVLLPSWHRPGEAKLPVLLDPYGGPHAQRVLAARGAFLTSQWLAEQGFAVVVADGRGTPGRGPDWDRAVWHDLAGPVLADQVEALQAAAGRHRDLDLGRVAIRGWSFGGYLAALAVLRRPDVFHAAIAGAPVTDWQLYDTHYTERYLGLPAAPGAAGDPYQACSLLADAPGLSRPLLLIHGLADDNVVAAHTLRFSSALLAAGRPHAVLPLSGVTHMTPQEEVAENLLLLQVDFLRRALGLDSGEPGV